MIVVSMHIPIPVLNILDTTISPGSSRIYLVYECNCTTLLIFTFIFLLRLNTTHRPQIKTPPRVYHHDLSLDPSSRRRVGVLCL